MSLPRVGVKVPNDGELPLHPGLGAMARAAEEAGFASVWTTDHVVQPLRVDSPYPFTSNARPEWVPETPWFDCLVALTAMAAATERVELGLAVLVAALRDPVVTAKQLASIDALAGGRVVCGVGAGWMPEEFAAASASHIFPKRHKHVRETIERRAATAMGAEELANESAAGRERAEREADHDAAARDKLEEIRRSLRGE